MSEKTGVQTDTHAHITDAVRLSLLLSAGPRKPKGHG